MSCLKESFFIILRKRPINARFKLRKTKCIYITKAPSLFHAKQADSSINYLSQRTVGVV